MKKHELVFKIDDNLENNIKQNIKNIGDTLETSIKFKFNIKKTPYAKAYKSIANAVEDHLSISAVKYEDGLITVFGAKRKKQAFIFPKTDTHFNKTKDRYQFHTLLAALSFVKNTRTAIDIGGHVGLYSHALCDTFTDVIAFEPSKINAACFRKNVPQAKLYTNGLGDAEKFVELNLADDNSGNNSIVESFNEGTDTIEIKTLDSFEFSGVDLIKIDVQGYEEQVIRGAKSTLEKNNPILIVELITHKDSPPNEAALKLLKEYKYKVLAIIGKDYIMGPK